MLSTLIALETPRTTVATVPPELASWYSRPLGPSIPYGVRVNAYTGEIFERKYEIDSLAAPLLLSYEYYNATGDATPFDDRWQKAVKLIIKTGMILCFSLYFSSKRESVGDSPRLRP